MPRRRSRCASSKHAAFRRAGGAHRDAAGGSVACLTGLFQSDSSGGWGALGILPEAVCPVYTLPERRVSALRADRRG